MPSLIDLRRRIRSVKNIQQITKAMKMVAAAKLRRSQDKILQTRPYALELRKVIQNLAAAAAGGEALHPLLETRSSDGGGKVLLAIVTGDKGLCGSFNTNILRRAEKERKSLGQTGELDLLLLGKRGADYYSRRRATVRAAHRALFANVTYEAAQGIAADVITAFTSGEYDAVHVVYNQFVSVLRQELTVEQLLPVAPELADDARGGEVDYLFEPSPVAILEELLPRFVTFQVYRVLLESQAAEHGARMTAMDAATKNAGELIDTLSLTYNRSRQAAITKELIEVVSGANALEG